MELDRTELVNALKFLYVGTKKPDYREGFEAVRVYPGALKGSWCLLRQTPTTTLVVKVGVESTRNPLPFVEAMVSGRDLLNTLNGIRDAAVEVNWKRGTITSASGIEGRFRVFTDKEMKDFPALPKHIPCVELCPDDLTVPAGTFFTALGAAEYCAGTKESRYAINGVFMEQRKRKFTMAGTDTKRLAVTEFNSGTKYHGDFEFIFPRDGLAWLHFMGNMGCPNIGIEYTDTWSKVKGKRKKQLTATTMTVRDGKRAILIPPEEGIYPKFHDAIPPGLSHSKNPETTVCGTGATWRDILEPATKVKVDRWGNGPSIELKLSSTGGKVMWDAGKLSRPLKDMLTISGKELEIAFNPFFLLAALDKYSDDGGTFGLSLWNSMAPARIDAILDNDVKCIGVIMPIRLRKEGE